MNPANPTGDPRDRSLTRYGCVLFDLDGVLTPTASVHEKAWRQTFEEVLPQLAPIGETNYRDDDYRLYIDGRPRFEGVSALLLAHSVALPWGDPSDPPGTGSVCAVGNMKNALFSSLLERESIAPYPGSMALLGVLDEAGVPVGVVSSSANARSVLAAAGLSERFDTVVDGVTVADLGLAGKPSPDPYLEAARQLGVAPESSVVIEDAIAGVESGVAGGFGLVVGVAREGDDSGLRAAGADIIVRDLGELL